MEKITKEFTYDTTDDQYSQTNVNLETGTLTYHGDAVKYVVVDRETNKLSGGSIPENAWMDGEYNDTCETDYAVRVDCNEETLICALIATGGNYDIDSIDTVSEQVPGSAMPYVRNSPMLPDHVYEVKEIEYNPTTNSFVKPFPWKAPISTWEDLILDRNNRLKNADRSLSEDLPESLYDLIAKYKKYLRNLPKIGGAAWRFELTNIGTGYSVGDQILISDPVFKNGTAAPDIVLTITAVDDNGGITDFSHSNAHCYTYHPEAATYSNVFNIQQSSGTGATITMSKIKTVNPWKINILRNPIESNDRSNTINMEVYNNVLNDI